MKVQWKKQSGPLLVSSCNLVQPKRGREEPTMTRATRTAEYTGATTLCLYLAFELGSNEWKLGFATEPGATPRVRTMPARDLARLTREIADAQQWFGVQAATPGAELLRGGPRRVLAAPVRDLHRDRERDRGLIEHRSESPAPAREVGSPGCPQAARDAAAVPRRGAEGLERGARAHGGTGGSAPAASRAPDLEAGTHAGGESDQRPSHDPGYRAAAGNRHRGRGQDGAPVGRLARARGAAGSVGAGVGARAILAHADSRAGTRTSARDCPRSR